VVEAQAARRSAVTAAVAAAVFAAALGWDGIAATCRPAAPPAGRPRRERFRCGQGYPSRPGQHAGGRGRAADRIGTDRESEVSADFFAMPIPGFHLRGRILGRSDRRSGENYASGRRRVAMCDSRVTLGT
jgi:hypothetical protein